jgi:Glycosyl hydrolase catalytic core
MQHSGASLYRLMVRPEANWQEKYDKAFRLAAERGITILPYLYNFNGSPQFPYAEATGPAGNAWETWVYTAVHRYGNNGELWNANPGVPYRPPPAWEVWNEPNRNSNNPGGASVQPEKYAQFLKRTSAAIQAAQKERTPGIGVPVLFGGLVSKIGDMSVAEFLYRSQNSGGGGVQDLGSYFNGLSLHPYSLRNGVTGPGGVQEQVTNARNSLNSFFNSTKQLWITELGWNVGNHPNEQPQTWVSLQDQASNLSGSFNWIKSVAVEKNIQTIIWFMYRDCVGCGLNWADFTGLRGADGSFRPAWYAFQEQTGAKAWPALEWQPMDNLGKPGNGGLTSDPDMSTWGLGRLDNSPGGQAMSSSTKPMKTAGLGEPRQLPPAGLRPERCLMGLQPHRHRRARQRRHDLALGLGWDEIRLWRQPRQTQKRGPDLSPRHLHAGIRHPGRVRPGR